MKALGFSLACRARYCSPPTSESAFRIIARKSALSLLGVPAGDGRRATEMPTRIGTCQRL